MRNSNFLQHAPSALIFEVEGLTAGNIDLSVVQTSLGTACSAHALCPQFYSSVLETCKSYEMRYSKYIKRITDKILVV